MFSWYSRALMTWRRCCWGVWGCAALSSQGRFVVVVVCGLRSNQNWSSAGADCCPDLPAPAAAADHEPVLPKNAPATHTHRRGNKNNVSRGGIASTVPWKEGLHAPPPPPLLTTAIKEFLRCGLSSTSATLSLSVRSVPIRRRLCHKNLAAAAAASLLSTSIMYDPLLSSDLNPRRLHFFCIWWGSQINQRFGSRQLVLILSILLEKSMKLSLSSLRSSRHFAINNKQVSTLRVRINNAKNLKYKHDKKKHFPIFRVTVEGVSQFMKVKFEENRILVTVTQPLRL